MLIRRQPNVLRYFIPFKSVFMFVIYFKVCLLYLCLRKKAKSLFEINEAKEDQRTQSLNLNNYVFDVL